MVDKKSTVLLIICLIMFSSCSSFENEKEIAKNAADKFYSNLNDKNDEEFNKYLDSKVVVNVFEKEQANIKHQSDVKERLNILRDIFKKVKSKNLQTVKAEGGEKGEYGVRVSTTYLLDTESGFFYQEIIWNVKKDIARIGNVFNYSYGEDGQLQVIVNDGKMIP